MVRAMLTRCATRLLVATAFVVAVPPDTEGSVQAPPCDLINVGGNAFCFPSGAARRSSISREGRSLVSIKLVLPEYRPLTGDDIVRFDALGGSSYSENTLGMVLIAGSTGVTWTWEQQVAEWRRLRVPIPDASVVPGNMRRLAFEPRSAEPEPWHSHFLVQVDGRDALLRCRPFQPVPSCFLQVLFRGTPLGISFPGSKLALWAEVHEGAVRFLESHAR